jgi:16S rRNA G966 N2-methylase RsmD
VENDAAALSALRQNLDVLQVGPEAKIVCESAWNLSFSSVPGESFALVFLDPPYRDSDDPSAEGAVTRYLTRLGEFTGPDSLVVLHHRSKVRYAASDLPAWVVFRGREFGTSAITVFARRSVTS